MSSNKVKVSETHAKEIRIDEFLTIYDYFSKEDWDTVSFVKAKLIGPHGNRVNARSAKLYYVTAGTLEMTVDSIEHTLNVGDALLVRPGKWHSMLGYNARVLIICAPAFDGADETISP